MIGFLYLTAALLATTVAGEACSSGWYHYNSSCYGYSDAQVSWAEAARVCQIFNGYLADVESAEENDFLKQICTEKQAEKVWIGATDMFKEGTWEWVTGSPFTFSDWHAGQPTDDGRHGEDCLDLNPEHNYEWADDHCTSNYNFICETTAKPE